jgi:hypothetical protein
MPDVSEVWTMHEQYKSPPVAVGELVLYKHLKKDNWDIGWVLPADMRKWQPGDPAGRQINIRICPRNFGQPLVIESCVHSKDPLYEYDTTGSRSCWEKVGITASSPSDMASLYNEIYAELKKSQAAEGELLKLKAELAQVKIIAENATSDVSKFSSQLSQLISRNRTPVTNKDAA